MNLSSIPSTRKRKAKERRFRQLDIISDVENADVMVGNYLRENERNYQSDSDLNLDPVSLQSQRDSNVVGEDFRSLLTNSRENSEITMETTRMINEEVSSQLSRRLNEINDSSNAQIQDAKAMAITEKVLPSIQNTLDTQARAIFTVVVRGSNGLQEGPRRTNFTVVDQGSNGLKKGSRAGNSTVVDQRSNGLQESPRTNDFTVVNQRSSGLQRSPPKLKSAKKRGKIVPKRILHRKIADKCLERV